MGRDPTHHTWDGPKRFRGDGHEQKGVDVLVCKVSDEPCGERGLVGWRRERPQRLERMGGMSNQK